jgi:hypothetical protein
MHRWGLICVALAPACGHGPEPSSDPGRTVIDYAKERAKPEPAPAADMTCPTAPRMLAPGLEHERQPLGATAATAEAACVDVLRIDLARFKPRLLSAARDGASHPAPTWRETFHLAAVINAGMFHSDGKPVGMLVEDGVALGNDNPKYAGYLAFDPRNTADPPIVIAGRGCDNFDLSALRKHYRSIVQSSRLLGCAGEALPWADPKQYSVAAIGVDRDGRLVMLHARAAVTMTQFAAALASPSMHLAGALFLEGGPEASLVARGSDAELSRVGSYETGFVENDGNTAFWWLPNVIGVEPR